MTMGPTQPPHADSPRVPITGDAPTGLTWEDWQTLFQTTLDSIKLWDEKDDPLYLEHRKERHHLHDLARALVIVSDAQLRHDDAWRAARGLPEARHDGTRARYAALEQPARAGRRRHTNKGDDR